MVGEHGQEWCPRTDLSVVLLAARLAIGLSIGLWANVATQWVRPRVLHAQDTANIESYLAEIASDVERIAKGICSNDKIC
jgi:hypothetical protein